ncbi:2864_t:CDS:2 [Diversispora eburnea]|uniref:2864_t:CDS:1 n=1 Tax=Diversispora eburnea TaxID=1213867 RepID=A0A9N9B1P1_9GLOM|nr:2864_t:CDS:2 [Diversispora eburnea]
MQKCLYCAQKDPDLDPEDGIPSEYCSDECRRNALSTEFTTPCITCGEFPRVKLSQYCGWTKCRNLKLCKKCEINIVTIANSFWCSKKCRNETPDWGLMIKSDELCLQCEEKYTCFGKDFCSDECLRWVEENGDKKFNDITNQFTSSWNHKYKATPSVHAVYKIFPNNEIITRYNKYRDHIESLRKCEGKQFPKGNGQRLMTKGNEQRRFHGTRMKCLLGISSDNICYDTTCALCNIISNGYKLSYNGINFPCQKFGPGLYFSGTSSKSDYFSKDSYRKDSANENDKFYKVMFLTKVVVGRAYEMLEENTSMKGPPQNYDSVVGEPNKDGKLNYDELVVYQEEACLPQYLIVYEKPENIL